METPDRALMAQAIMLGDPDVVAYDAGYAGVPDDVAQDCERLWSFAREAVVTALRDIRDKLAPYGTWKAWCAGHGVDYSHANYVLNHQNWQTVRESSTVRLPEPESPTLAAIRAVHERAIVEDAALVDSQPAEIQAAVLADLEAGAKGNVRWRVGEARRAIVREANRQLIEEHGVPVSRVGEDGSRYPTVVIDPPWEWVDEAHVLAWGRGPLGRAGPDYATMPMEEIAALPIADVAADQAHVYLWIATPWLYRGVARDLFETWGFRYGTVLTWDKQSFGIGQTFRVQTEHCVVGYRGSLPLLNHDTPTIFRAPRPGPHSAKPDVFYDLVQSCSPGPWLELFSRQVRGPGWVCWGEDGIRAGDEVSGKDVSRKEATG